MITPYEQVMVRPDRRVLTGALALAAVAAITAVSLMTIAPPEPRPASAPASEFSAERAFGHLEEIADAPRPVGSAANRRAGDYLISELKALGLNVDVQQTVGRDPSPRRPPALASVRNMTAVLPGKESVRRVFLVAHYDSVAAGPGASDDGAGVAALLETARALTASPQLRHDVVFVFTDAEEACLCGAEAFVREHPLARDGGVVLNLEARGSRGPAVMFQTSVGNARLVDAYAEWAPHPVSTSFAVEVYRLLPNDTDFTAFLGADRGAGGQSSSGSRSAESRFVGLNSAFLDGSAHYHTALDRPTAIDLASLQDHGANALALARGFGDSASRPLLGAETAAQTSEMAGSTDDATYFPVLGVLVRYPGALTWPLAILAGLAVATLAVLARRRGLARLPRIAAGAGLTLLALALTIMAAVALWRTVTLLWPTYGAFRVGDPYQPALFRWAVLATTAAVLLGWHAVARRIGPAALAIGALCWPALLGLLTAATIPGGSYLGALPALAAASAGIVALSVPTRPCLGAAALTAGATVSALVYAPVTALLFPALGMNVAGAAALFAALAGLTILPLLDLAMPQPRSAGPAADSEPVSQTGSVIPRRREAAPLWKAPWKAPGLLRVTPPVTAALLAVALTGAGVAVNQVTPTQPRPAHLAYGLNADTGEAIWLSADDKLSIWSRRHVRRPARVPEAFPMLGSEKLRTGEAKPATLAAPQITVLSERSDAGRRTIRLRLRSGRGAPVIGLYVAHDAQLLAASVAGRSVAVDRVERVGRWGFGVTYAGLPPKGVTVTLTTAGVRPLRARVVDQTHGLAGLPGFVPRPADLTATPGHHTDVALVARSHTL